MIRWVLKSPAVTKEENQPMGYEIYEKEFPSKSTSPTITISPLGRCSLNRAAAAMFHKEAVENVLLLWDKDSHKFAVRPITKKDARSFNIRYSMKEKMVVGAGFSGVLFLRHIGYNFTTTSTYPIKWDANQSLFEVELPKERLTGAPSLVAVEGGKRNAKVAAGD
jgi:hypothetical protein